MRLLQKTLLLIKQPLNVILILSSLWLKAQDIPVITSDNNVRPAAMTNVQNIEELKNLKDRRTGDLVYVNGYYTISDKGGGYFSYLDPDSSKGITPDSGINIHPNDGIGIWKRINYGQVSVAYFGAIGSDAIDDTEAIQEAINVVANYFKTSFPKGGIIYFPKGVYLVQEIILKNRVSLIGEYSGTIIKPTKKLNGTYNNSLVRLDDGFVENISVEGFMFYGDVPDDASTNPDQNSRIEVDMHCFDFNADGTDGGLWNSSFKNITIRKFKRDGMRFKGGSDYETNNYYDRVNQFNSFENIRIIKSNSVDSRAIYMFGQNAQINFINCTFSGSNSVDNAGTNVWIESTSQNPEGPVGPGPQTSLINFDTCTFENSERGFMISGAFAVNIRGCWFENLNSSLDILDFSRGIDISGNKFSNAGRVHLLSLENSGVSFTNNVIRQAQKVSILKLGSDRRYYGKNNYREVPGTRDFNYFN
jgi:Pectate lyase superfamily protein